MKEVIILLADFWVSFEVKEVIVSIPWAEATSTHP